MTELQIKHQNESHRNSILNFLNTFKYKFDFDITNSKSLTKKIVIEIEEEYVDDFISSARYKKFNFHEI